MRIRRSVRRRLEAINRKAKKRLGERNRKKPNFHQYEPLEIRRVLNAAPVAIADLLYFTDYEIDLVVTTANGLLKNDFDADAGTLTASKETDPTNGNISTWNSNGTFTYEPDDGFQGNDFFTYKISDSTDDSRVVTVGITVGEGLSPMLNGEQRTGENMLHTGALTTYQPLGGGLDLVYRSDTIPNPLVAVETVIAPGTTLPTGANDKLLVELEFDGVAQTELEYDTTGLATGEPIRFVQGVDNSTISTGMYDWTMTITFDYDTGDDIVREFSGQQAVVNRTGSEFGSGWWLDGLDRLYVQSSPDPEGALLVNGDATTIWFAEDTGGDYQRAPGDLTYSLLEFDDTNNIYTVTDKWGDKRVFDVDGYLTGIVPLNNDGEDRFTFSYNGSDQLETITDQFDRTYDFTYSGGYFATYNDFADRDSVITFDGNNRLWKVKVADETGYTGSATAPQWEFTYQAVDDDYYLDVVKDPASKETEYFFDSGHRLLTQIEYHDGADWFLYPTMAEGFTEDDDTTILEVEDKNARFTDEEGNTYKFQTDDFGNITYMEDPESVYQQFEIDDYGQTYRVTDYVVTAFPLPQPALVTEYGYTDMGDLVFVQFPDLTYQSGTYDDDLHRVKTWTNELGNTDNFSYDPDTGDLLHYWDERGNETFSSTQWNFTYDEYGNLTDVVTPDPDGDGYGGGTLYSTITTSYEYDTKHRLDTITFDDDTTHVFTYTDSDQVDTFTNELGFVTDYDYDPLDRLVKVTLPDPDGESGGPESPIYEYEYGANLLVSKEIDPRDYETTYTYNDRHWLTTLTLPDPDGSGGGNPLTTPEFEYTYYLNGLLETEIRPEFKGTGTKIEYEYDGAGRLTETSGPLADQDYTYGYDYLGRLDTQIDPTGRKITYGRDKRDRIEVVTDHDPDGTGPLTSPVTTFEYDNAGQLESVTDPLGRETSYEYEDTGWLKKVIVPDPNPEGNPYVPPSHTYEYDALGRQSKSIDTAGRETVTKYDVRHRVIEVIAPDPDPDDGSVEPTSTYYAYDDAGRLEDFTDAMGFVTAYEYDDVDRLTKVILPDPDNGMTQPGPEYAYEYDASGNLTKLTAPLSRVTNADYDGLNRMIKLTQPDPAGAQTSPIWELAFNDDMRLVSITDPLSHDRTATYDDAGRLASVLDPLSNETSYTYTLIDQLKTITTPDPDGASGQDESDTTYTYDDYGNIETIDDPESGLTSYAYDAAGQMLSLTDPESNTTRWAYDVRGRKTMEMDQIGYTRSFFHNSLGELVRQADKNGNIIWNSKEGYTRREHWVEPTGDVPEVSIDTTTQGSGSADEVQTVTLVDAPDGIFRLAFDGETTAHIAYNAPDTDVEAALEALHGIDDVDVDGEDGGPYTVTFVGDQAKTDVSQIMGDVMLEEDGDVIRRFDFVYDENWRLIETYDLDTTGESDVPVSIDYEFEYDDIGRLEQQTEIIEGFTGDVVLDFEYDDVGNRTKLKAKIDGTADYENVYTFDELDRLTKVIQKDVLGGNEVAPKRAEFEYNKLGQFTYIYRYESFSVDTIGLRTDFGYDTANRLTKIDHREISSSTTSQLHQYEFDYDDMSRIIEIDSTEDGISSFEFDLNSQITDADHAVGRTDELYVYDDNGNRDDDDYVVGTNNHTTTDGTYDYEYDREGNRTTRTADDGSETTYEYDHRNRLTSVQFFDSDANSNVLLLTIDYTYDVYNRLVKRTVDDTATVTDKYFAGFDGDNPTFEFDGDTEDDLTHRYLWGPVVDQLLSDEIVTSLSSAGDVQWALQDQVGTIRDIAAIDGTSGEFEIANHRVYDSFGNLESETDSDVDLSFGFTGKWTDPDTGMTHHLFRWFDPGIGKWISEDPLGFKAGDTNLSRYVANQPLSMTDPTGLLGAETYIEGDAAHGSTEEMQNPGDPDGERSGADDKYRPSKKPKNVPHGTKDINKHPKTKDFVHDIKDRLREDGTGVGPKSWVGITPEDEIIASDLKGEAERIGTLDVYLPMVGTKPLGEPKPSWWSEFWRRQEIRSELEDYFDSHAGDVYTYGGVFVPINPGFGRIPVPEFPTLNKVPLRLRIPLPGGFNPPTP